VILINKTIVFVIFVITNDEEGTNNFIRDIREDDTHNAAIIFRKEREIVFVVW
jgi:hypothetical protein